MTRQVTQVRILVAAPSDVDSERDLLEKVVAELNTVWPDTLGIRLELYSWKSHVQPGAGCDPQDVINRALPDDYDILIGIMWSRFGSPTPRAGSGTEEEFNRALARHRENPEAVQVMFYFKDDPLPPSRLDASQIQKIADFKARLETEGVLYWPFAGSFETVVRVHLSLEIARRVRAAGIAEPRPARAAGTEASHGQTSEADEPGIFDEMERFTSHMATVGSSRARLLKAMKDLNEQLESAIGGALPTGVSYHEAKAAANRAAAALDVFSSHAEREIPVLEGEFEEAMRGFGNTMALAADYASREQLYTPALRETIGNAVNTLAENELTMQRYRNTISRTPRLTVVLNRAKRRALDVFGQLERIFREERRLLAQVFEVER